MVGGTVGNFFSIPHSQMYAESERLAKAGYLAEDRERAGRRRKRYSLTKRGRKALNDWIETPTDELYELRDPGLLKLGFGTDPKTLAAAQLEAHKKKLAELEAARDEIQVQHQMEHGSCSRPASATSASTSRFWSKVAGSASGPSP